MADTRTYATMQSRIADELSRPDLTSEIQNAIQDACYYYQQEQFFFNEAIDSTTVTVAGTNTYAGPSDLLDIEALEINISSSGIIYPLHPRRLDWVLDRDEMVNPPLEGQPTDYAIFANQFRLWPTPDNAYGLKFYYRQQIPPPTQPTDGGFWMTTAEAMIRAYAKGILYSQILMLPDKAKVEFEISHQFYQQLKSQTASKLFTGKSKAWTW